MNVLVGPDVTQKSVDRFAKDNKEFEEGFKFFKFKDITHLVSVLGRYIDRRANDIGLITTGTIPACEAVAQFFVKTFDAVLCCEKHKKSFKDQGFRNVWIAKK